MVVLIWVDDAYGLISWKMELELGHDVDTTFTTPTSPTYAESFGASGYRITSADQLLPTLRRRLRPTPSRSSPARWTTRPTRS